MTAPIINRPDIYDEVGQAPGQLPYTLPAPPPQRSPMIFVWAVLSVFMLVLGVSLIAAGIAIKLGVWGGLIALGLGIVYIGWRIEQATQ